jgi:hypothetical protein
VTIQGDRAEFGRGIEGEKRNRRHGAIVIGRATSDLAGSMAARVKADAGHGIPP